MQHVRVMGLANRVVVCVIENHNWPAHKSGLDASLSLESMSLYLDHISARIPSTYAVSLTC